MIAGTRVCAGATLVALTGCGSDVPLPVAEPDVVDTGTPDAVDTGESTGWGVDGPENPDWSVDELLARFASATSRGLPEPVSLRNVYRDMMVWRDDDCPSMESADSDSWVGVWFGDCDTSDGAHFYGTAIFSEFEDPGDDEVVGHDAGMVASFEITDPDGVSLIGGGGFTISQMESSTGKNFEGFVGGTYAYPAVDGFIGAGVEASLWYVASGQSGYDTFAIDGGVGVGDFDMIFEDLRVSPDVCDGLPQGRIKLRDPTGYWFDLALADCSACGAVTWRQRSLGDLCLGEPLKAAVQVTAVALDAL